MRLLEKVGILILSLIPVAAFLAMFEIYTFPTAYRWDAYLIGGYALLCFAIVNYRIVRGIVGWLSRSGRTGDQ